MQDTQIKDEMTQLLVLKNCREVLFYASHLNSMAGQDKTFNHLMAYFYWLGIHGDVRKWSAACTENPLPNDYHGPYRAIIMDCMRALICISINGLCNTVPRNHSSLQLSTYHR